tara:strand:+ start:1563 stop:2030 length:468 start_codon:yes stop_codon:yes gene_type:complete
MYDFADEQPKETGLQIQGECGDVPLMNENRMDLDSALVGDLAGDLAGDDGYFPETRHTSEFSFDLHGKEHPDALYRAAGGNEGRTPGQLVYGCPCCGRGVGRVIRVRPTKKSAWMGVCAMCAAATLAKHPEAVIGGLIRAGRRRRRSQRGLRDAG